MSEPICLTVESTVQKLLSEDRWRILCHRYPDGDTIGSAVALCRALQYTGRKARVECADVFPEKYAYLTEEITFDAIDDDAPVCAVDVADARLLGEKLEAAYGDRVELCIDHHGSNTGYARQLLLKDYAAAAMVVYELVRELCVPFDRLIAESLYTGIATDTGCFKYSNTDALTHRMAAELMDCDIRADAINRAMFDVKSRARIELERLALAGMRFEYGGRMALMPITLEMVEKSGALENDMEGLAPIPRQIEGVWVGVTLREKADGRFKVSVRTGTHANAATVCALLGGGGHAAAAGCELDGPLEAAMEQMRVATERALPNIVKE